MWDYLLAKKPLKLNQQFLFLRIVGNILTNVALIPGFINRLSHLCNAVLSCLFKSLKNKLYESHEF